MVLCTVLYIIPSNSNKILLKYDTVFEDRDELNENLDLEEFILFYRNNFYFRKGSLPKELLFEEISRTRDQLTKVNNTVDLLPNPFH